MFVCFKVLLPCWFDRWHVYWNDVWCFFMLKFMLCCNNLTHCVLVHCKALSVDAYEVQCEYECVTCLYLFAYTVLEGDNTDLLSVPHLCKHCEQDLQKSLSTSWQSSSLQKIKSQNEKRELLLSLRTTPVTFFKRSVEDCQASWPWCSCPTPHRKWRINEHTELVRTPHMPVNCLLRVQNLSKTQT